MVIGIDHAQLEAEISNTDEAFRHQVVACPGNVIADFVVYGVEEVHDGVAGDAVAPGYSDVGGAAVGTPEGAAREYAGWEGGCGGQKLVAWAEGPGGRGKVRSGGGFGEEGGNLRSGYSVGSISTVIAARTQV